MSKIYEKLILQQLLKIAKDNKVVLQENSNMDSNKIEVPWQQQLKSSQSSQEQSMKIKVISNISNSLDIIYKCIGQENLYSFVMSTTKQNMPLFD